MKLVLCMSVALLLCADQQLAAQTSAAPSARLEYARRLERAFLTQGADARVRAEGDERDLLIIRIPVTRVGVFALITKLQMLQMARAEGFRGLSIISMSGESWNFRIPASGPLPDCDIERKVCR